MRAQSESIKSFEQVNEKKQIKPKHLLFLLRLILIQLIKWAFLIGIIFISFLVLKRMARIALFLDREVNPETFEKQDHSRMDRIYLKISASSISIILNGRDNVKENHIKFDNRMLSMSHKHGNPTFSINHEYGLAIYSIDPFSLNITKSCDDSPSECNYLNGYSELLGSLPRDSINILIKHKSRPFKINQATKELIKSYKSKYIDSVNTEHLWVYVYVNENDKNRTIWESKPSDDSYYSSSDDPNSLDLSIEISLMKNLKPCYDIQDLQKRHSCLRRFKFCNKYHPFYPDYCSESDPRLPIDFNYKPMDPVFLDFDGDDYKLLHQVNGDKNDSDRYIPPFSDSDVHLESQHVHSNVGDHNESILHLETLITSRDKSLNGNGFINNKFRISNTLKLNNISNSENQNHITQDYSTDNSNYNGNDSENQSFDQGENDSTKDEVRDENIVRKPYHISQESAYDLSHLASVESFNSVLENTPIIIIASYRPFYLIQVLERLLSIDGVNKDMVTVYVDGFHQDTVDVAELFNVRHVSFSHECSTSCAIQQHYFKSITEAFESFPKASEIIILEEDLLVGPDFMFFFAQTIPLLRQNQTFYCASAWNDQNYKHSSGDPRMVYITETMPGLGWALSRKLFDEIKLEWPKGTVYFDWDIWMRMDKIRKGRECIIPDISRTFHIGRVGYSIGDSFQHMHFDTRPMSQFHIYGFDLSYIEKNVYDQTIKSLISHAPVIPSDSKICDLAASSLEKTEQNKNMPIVPIKGYTYPELLNRTRVVYLENNDLFHRRWGYLAKCWKLWTMDRRDFHNKIIRIWMDGIHYIVVRQKDPVYFN